MKRLLFLTCVLLSVLPMNAQSETDYRPFIEDGKIWVTYQSVGGYVGGILNGSYTRYDFFNGDTTISGRKCQRWVQRYVKDDDNYDFFVYAFEENRKVYFFFESDTIPRLMFDFGVKEGDSITVCTPFSFLRTALYDTSGNHFSYENFYCRKIGIGSINYMLKDGRKQKIINIIDSGCLPIDYVMEGIGSCMAPDWYFSDYNRWAGGFLIYCQRGDEVLYADEEKAQLWGISPPTFITTLQTVNHKSVNRQCFDLSGRRLASPPAKGVYIKDGKKVAR